MLHCRIGPVRAQRVLLPYAAVGSMKNRR